MEDIFYEGVWWRFDKYEIRDGYIRPASRAALKRWQPLDDFQAIRAGRREQDSPYQSLLRLVNGLRWDANAQLILESTDALLRWCGENGLLGLLLHQVQVVRFAPRWEHRIEQPVPPDVQAAAKQLRDSVGRSRDAGMKQVARWFEQPPPKREPLFYTQRMYSRSSCGSFRFGDIQTLTTTLKGHRQQRGKIVSGAQWHGSACDVLIHNFWTGDWEEEPITKTWARFFPRIPAEQRATYQYPEPYSDEFWHLYAEPVDDFLAAARMFKQAFDSAALFKESEEIDDGGDGIKPTMGKLNALVPAVGPALVKLPDGGVEQRVVSPSLLGSLAVMAQQDLASDRRVIRCANDKCRLVFVVVGYQTRHCSRQCAFVAEKRAYRARLKARAAKRRGPGERGRRKRTSAGGLILPASSPYWACYPSDRGSLPFALSPGPSSIARDKPAFLRRRRIGGSNGAFDTRPRRTPGDISRWHSG